MDADVLAQRLLGAAGVDDVAIVAPSP